MTTALRAAGAEFFSSPRLVTRSGQRALVESVRELRYAVEGSPDKEGRTVPVAFETRNVGTTVEIEPFAGPDDNLDLAINATLVDFVGFIDPANVSRKTGQSAADDLARALSAPLKAGGLWQPVFDTSKIVTSFKLQSGQMVILGGLAEKPATPDASKPAAKARPKPEARLVYVLLTAEAVHP